MGNAIYEYFNKKHEIQKEELSSNRFKDINDFYENKIMNRKNLDLEEKILYIFNKKPLTLNISNRKIMEYYQVSLYNWLTKSLNQIDFRVIDNIYIENIKNIIDHAFIDCASMISGLENELNAMHSNEDYASISIESNVPSYIDKIIPKKINMRVAIPYYKTEDYRFSYINVLDDDHIHIYKAYNEYLEQMRNITSFIYFMTMNAICSFAPYDIFNTNLNLYEESDGTKYFHFDIVKGKEEITEKNLGTYRYIVDTNYRDYDFKNKSLNKRN